MRKAFILSLDALAAVGLLFILTGFLASLSMSYSSPELRYQRLYYAGKDVMNVMERVKLSAVIGFMPANYTGECNITSYDMDKTVLDVLGYLWAQNSTTLNQCASNLTEMILNMTLGPDFGYEVILGGTNISSRGEEGDYLSRLHTIVSGYELGKPVSGYMASAYLARMTKSTSSYAYFGGYVGDGNITAVINIPEDANVTNAYLEMSVGNNFTLWVNGKHSGVFYPSPFNMTADNWTICSDIAGCNNFTDGRNVVSIRFNTGEKNYIGGGYLKVTYNTSKPDTLPFSLSNETALKYYNLPGIEGAANLYSSFYVPGDLGSMLLHLHYYSNCTANCSVFMNIGNVTVYESNETGERTLNITNSTLYPMLYNFTMLNSNTVPLRMGLRNVTHTQGGEGIGDPILVTDVSGSMLDCANNSAKGTCFYQYRAYWLPFIGWVWLWENCPYTGTCNDDECVTGKPTRNHYTCDTKLDVAKTGNKNFIDIVLNVSGNRVGLVNYSTNTRGSYNLTSNSVPLKNVIDSYKEEGSTCICCGIISATSMLTVQSNSSRRRSMVVMSDGQANVRCNNAVVSLDGDADVDAHDDTIQAACTAYDNYGIVVYAIAYGNDANNNTMNLTAQCGHGKYYYSNATALAETYKEIAQEISINYYAQTVFINASSYNITLFDDSYIEINYTPKEFLGYGEVSIAMESDRFGGSVTSPKNKTVFIPVGCRILDAKVTSYSSEFWTSYLRLNSSVTGGWQTVYNLSDFSASYGKKDEFIDLGDPFEVHLPSNLLKVGENNSVSIDTGFSSADKTGGSPDDRVIYYAGVSGIVGYGEVFPMMQNATDDAVQRLHSQLSGFNITLLEIKTTAQYISELPSLWGPSVMEIRIWS